MSTFAEHLEKTRHEDGEYHLDEAEAAHAEALMADETGLVELAARAAKADRKAWESRNRDQLKKQLTQPALSADFDLDALVPLGQNVAVPLRIVIGDERRIRLRMDMRTRKHVDENDAYGREMDFWYRCLDDLR